MVVEFVIGNRSINQRALDVCYIKSFNSQLLVATTILDRQGPDQQIECVSIAIAISIEHKSTQTKGRQHHK